MAVKAGFHAPVLVTMPVATRDTPDADKPTPETRAKLHPQIQNRWDDEKKNQQHTPAVKQKISDTARYITRHENPQTCTPTLPVGSRLQALLHFL
jgi:hypothetical protein